MRRFGEGHIPTLKAAVAYATRIGCSAEPVGRTGEYRCSPPAAYRASLKPVRYNNRRTDAPRALVRLIRDVEAMNGPGITSATSASAINPGLAQRSTPGK